MERTRRRFFTVAVSAAAVLIILAAAASGLFQIAVQAVPGYREDLQRAVRDVTGRPVSIDTLGLTWRYYYPSVELVGVALLNDDGTPLLQAERLRLGFSLVRLASGDWMPSRLELHGLALDVRIDREGELQVKGLDTASTDDAGSADLLRPLTRFQRLRLERCRLNVRDERRRGEVLSFGVAAAQLDRGLLNDELDVDVTLPASLGEAARLHATINGEPLEPGTWSGRVAAEATGLVASTWLAPYLVRGASIEAAGAEARIEAQLERGAFTTVELQLRTGAVRAQRARHEAAFDDLDARVSVEMLNDGWRARLRRLVLSGGAGRWPNTEGELRATLTDGAPAVYEGRLGYLRIADAAPWLQMLPVPAAAAALANASGDVEDLQLRVQGSGDDLRYGYRARFDELALPAQERPAGFSGVHGEVAGDERGGRAVLQEGPVSLDLPGMLMTPTVPLETFEGEIEWRRLDDGWRIGMPQFRWELWTTRGRGRFDLLLPEEKGRSPEIDLRAEFLAEDATRAKPLMPQHWSAGLRNWLDRSIIGGRAPRAELAIKGPLADFPFNERQTGHWALDIEASDILLQYQPDWPAVEDLDASLKFRGSSLSIESRAGTVAGNPIKQVSARFPEFRTGQLLIDGTVTGELPRYYDFLARSPLREKFKGLLGQTTATGPAEVDIHLDIPVSHAADTEVSGRVSLDGADLRHGGLPQPLRDIRGDIRFAGRGGVTSEKLTGKLYDLPIEASLVPQPDGSSLLTAGLRFTLDASGKGASELVPAWIRRKASGASDWRAMLVIGGAQDTPVRLTTDMTGVEVRLPPPLGKAANQAVPLTLTVGGAPGVPLHITADYAERLGADLRFARRRQKLELERGTLRVGAGPLLPPEEPGLVLVGSVGEADLRAWHAELKGTGLEDQVQVIRRADLHVGRALWGRYAVRDARYQWATQRSGWTLSLAGAGGTGEVRWSGGEQGQLTARLDQLALDLLEPAAEEEAGEPLDPSRVPALDVDVRHALVGSADLGHVTVVTARTEAGQRFRTLAVEGGSVNLTGTGEWRRRAGQSSATLNAELATSDIATLLRAFGYTPNLDAKSARFKGALTWLPADGGIEWHQAQGTVHLEFDNGQLRAVEPGAGRVLGLVNFYALPRRLTLNFRDVLGSGLGFDKVAGDFELRDGDARTQNLDIDGPSLRMEVRGRIGLAARDYDQQVTVYPDVSAGVTLGAVLLGGPVAGALALIAQEVLNKPLNQVTQLTYRVTGSWDNPQVERAAGAPGASKRERPTGPPSQKP